jgi:pimeloyl-ACP methyl ester carboxylesterase
MTYPALHSKILGEGKPLLILHGFLGMLDNWKTLGSRYAKEALEVHLIDQRNHGGSFWSDEFHYDAMASDLQTYMEHHSLESAVVLGHSMGGKTAMHFASAFPGHVQKLIVVDMGPNS